MVTKRQKQVLDFIKSFRDKKEYAPSLEEIKRHLHLSSVSTAHHHVKSLEEMGYLSKQVNSPRSIDLYEAQSMVQVPILGTIAAGLPLTLFDIPQETIAVPKSKIPSSSKVYALKVVGNSMIDENINDGDVILVRHQETAENGQKVVALISASPKTLRSQRRDEGVKAETNVNTTPQQTNSWFSEADVNLQEKTPGFSPGKFIDNQEATLKKFYKERGGIRLQPANKNIEPLIFRNGRDISIQGIVLDVIRDISISEGSLQRTQIKPTGYSIYNQDAERRTKHNPLPSLYPQLPNKKFDIIYTDPPWYYNGKMQFDKSSKSKEKIDLTRRIFISSAAFKYPTLKTSELREIPIQEIAKDDCLLFMWSTNPHLAQAIELGNAWGFEYKTVAFVWDKMNHNPGQYTLSNCELCLVFKRGRIPRPRGARNIQQLVRSPRRDHSEKPIEVMQAIEKMFPTQERIELFARKKSDGWAVWGLDVIMENNERFLLQKML